MNEPTLSCIELGGHLEHLHSQLLVNNALETWQDVELTAQNLANGLRIKDGPEDNHTALGNASLPQTLTSLLSCALSGGPIPDDAHAGVVFEIFRVAANLCMDHDENRGHLLEAGFPQAIVSLLEGYSESIVPPPQHEPPPAVSIPHLKVIRTAIGVLLNASINFDAVKFRLISLEAAVTIMKLSTAIYPPGSWANIKEQAPHPDPDNIRESIIESWTLRCGLSNWAWRTISELKDVKDDSRQIFGPDVLALIIPPLLAFIPPFLEPSGDSFFAQDTPLRSSLLQIDFDILEESCTLLESLSLDIEDVRLSLARGLNFPAEHGGVPCLCAMLDFIEKGDYHSLWYKDSGIEEAERKRRERSFDICKAAIIKVVVEVAGEEKNEEVLWDDSEEGKPGGEFVCRMVKWIKQYVQTQGQKYEASGSNTITRDRDDLVICASLSLGNLSRRETHSTTLLSPPHALAPILASSHLLSPSTDIKLKHGVLGLLKHLAQSASPSVYSALSDAGVVRSITTSGVWDERTDAMAEVVQVSAIGVVKHLCNANVESTFALVLPAPNQEPASTGLSQILALVRRSDSVPVKSEGTRVLVNIIKSLWAGNLVANKPTGHGGIQDDSASCVTQKKRNEAMQLVLKPQCALALASLVSRSGKYPLLVNEGLVALSLLSTSKEGALLVINAIVASIPSEMVTGVVSTPPSASTSSDVGSPVVTSPVTRTRGRRALDMLIAVLKNVDTGSNYPVEIRVNVCSLILQLGKNSSSAQFARIKDATQPVLEDLAEDTQGVEGKKGMLGVAVQKVLDAWG